MGYVAMSGEIYENSFFKPLLWLFVTALNGGKIFSLYATRKSQIFHTNHMLGITLDFTVSDTGLPSIFLRAQPCVLVKSCILQALQCWRVSVANFWGNLPEYFSWGFGGIRCGQQCIQVLTFSLAPCIHVPLIKKYCTMPSMIWRIMQI